MSSEIVIEIANWPASDAYKADPSVVNPALELLAAAKGSQKCVMDTKNARSPFTNIQIA